MIALYTWEKPLMPSRWISASLPCGLGEPSGLNSLLL
jgi:hypothetical protein